MTTLHYAGALEYDKADGMTAVILGGWAACCAGPKAMKIREEGRNTWEESRVTCKRCLAIMEKAAALAASTPDLSTGRRDDRSRGLSCSCGVSKGLRADHAAECLAAYLHPRTAPPVPMPLVGGAGTPDLSTGPTAVLLDAAKRLGLDPLETPWRCGGVTWWAFPQTWGSTSLGFGGPGGQMMTTATTTVVIREAGYAGPAARVLVYFGSGFAYEVPVTRALEAAIAAQRMPSKGERGRLSR